MKKFVAGALIISSLLFGVSGTSAVKEVDSQPNQFIASITYHMFDETSNHGGVNVTPDDFRDQLKLLKEMGYESITNGELEAYLDGEGHLPPKPLMITIDDGYESVYKNAYPILKELGMEATLFVITSHVESGERLGLPMMTWEELREVHNSGVIEVEGHTHDLHFRHGEKAGQEAMIMNLDRNGNPITEEQRKQMIIEDMNHAKALLKENVGVDTTAFSYPYGALDSTAVEAVEQTGVRMAYTTKHGVITKGDNKLLLNRIGGTSYYDPTHYPNRFAELAEQRGFGFNEAKGWISTYKNGTVKASLWIDNEQYTDWTRMKQANFEIWKPNSDGTRTYVRKFGEYFKVNDPNTNVITMTDKAGLPRGTYHAKLITTTDEGKRDVVWKSFEVK